MASTGEDGNATLSFVQYGILIGFIFGTFEHERNSVTTAVLVIKLVIKFPRRDAIATIISGHKNMQQQLVKVCLFWKESAFLAKAAACLEGPGMIGSILFWFKKVVFLFSGRSWIN